MHEMALCQRIIEIVDETARSQGFSRIVSVRLEIGALSSVEPEAIAFGFDVASRNTAAEGCRLRIDRPPGQAYCIDCGDSTVIASRSDPCPRCGGYQLLVTGGEELRVMELEVE
ncbi:MAG: hydrogenase maturation nickel metallochaperone HypA [Azospirillaceae bacterium]|nr:hydrogenase maturation nickel metallochaperone HypA [Azospirillaceae bacterium]